MPGPDVPPSPTGRTPDVDPRVTLLVEEVFRHAKAIATVGRGAEVLPAADVPHDVPAVLTDLEAGAVWPALTELLATHRAWERFPVAVG